MDRTIASHLSRFALILSLLPVACVGHIGGDDNEGPGEPASRPGSSSLDAAPAHVRRLTARQYVNTVRELLGAPDAAPVVVDDEGSIPSALAIEKLNLAAESLVALGAHRKLVPCAVETGDDECAKKFIDGFGARAFRRPLESEESAWLFAVYATARTSNTFAESIDQLTRVILQAPQLYYFAEEGYAESSLPGSLRRLTGYERASRLSYLLWDSMPDAALTAAARDGKLDTKEGVAAEARRMLNDSRARETLRRFLIDDWLGLSGSNTHVGIEQMVTDRAVFPDDSAALRKGMRADVEHLVDKVYDDGASLRALLTSKDAYVNAPLAKVYGVSGAPDGTASSWVKLDPAQRSGLLTRASYLAVYSNPTVKSPIRRGAQLIKHVLCLDVGDPPPTVSDVPIPAETDGGVHLTVRQTVTKKTSSPECAGCHSIINPAGFAFEHYDGIGIWNKLEGTLAIDATGELRGTDVAGTFTGAIEMSERLATSRALKDCLVSRWFGKTFGRSPISNEVPSVDEAKAHFAGSDDLKELVLGVVQSPAFLYVRTPEK